MKIFLVSLALLVFNSSGLNLDPSDIWSGSGGKDSLYTNGNGGLKDFSNGCPSSRPCKFGLTCCPQAKIRGRLTCHYSYCPRSTATTGTIEDKKTTISTRSLIEKLCGK